MRLPVAPCSVACRWPVNFRLLDNLPLAEKVADDTPLKAAALTICALTGGAGGVLVNLCLGARRLTYGESSTIGAAVGVVFGLVYLLI